MALATTYETTHHNSYKSYTSPSNSTFYSLENNHLGKTLNTKMNFKMLCQLRNQITNIAGNIHCCSQNLAPIKKLQKVSKFSE